jgi:hypothetical protein
MTEIRCFAAIPILMATTSSNSWQVFNYAIFSDISKAYYLRVLASVVLRWFNSDCVEL